MTQGSLLRSSFVPDALEHTVRNQQQVRGLYKYGNHLTPGVTDDRSYAAFFTSFLVEGLWVRFRGIPALKTA